MTEQKTRAGDELLATVKAIAVCWDFFNQIDPQVFDERETEQEFNEAFEAIRLAINELDEMGLVTW